MKLSEYIVESLYPDFRLEIDNIFNSIGHDIIPISQDAENAAEILASSIESHMQPDKFEQYSKLPWNEKFKQLLDVTKRYY